MVRIQDIAHYGRWFPDERDYTLWWFDREKEKMIDADELCKLFNCDVHSLNSIPVSYTHLTLPTILLV